MIFFEVNMAKVFFRGLREWRETKVLWKEEGMARHHAIVLSIVLSIATITPTSAERLWSDEDSPRPSYIVASGTYADGVDR